MNEAINFIKDFTGLSCISVDSPASEVLFEIESVLDIYGSMLKKKLRKDYDNKRKALVNRIENYDITLGEVCKEISKMVPDYIDEADILDEIVTEYGVCEDSPITRLAVHITVDELFDAVEAKTHRTVKNVRTVGELISFIEESKDELDNTKLSKTSNKSDKINSRLPKINIPDELWLLRSKVEYECLEKGKFAEADAYLTGWLYRNRATAAYYKLRMTYYDQLLSELIWHPNNIEIRNLVNHDEIKELITADGKRALNLATSSSDKKTITDLIDSIKKKYNQIISNDYIQSSVSENKVFESDTDTTKKSISKQKSDFKDHEYIEQSTLKPLESVDHKQKIEMDDLVFTEE